MTAGQSQERAKEVAVFLPSLEAGGAEGVMTLIINELASRGLPVRLLLARKSGHYLGEMDDRVEIIELGGGGVVKALVPLVKHLATRPPATILAAMSHANIIACLAASLHRRSSLRLVLSERMSLSARESFYATPGERSILAAMTLLYRRADAIIVPSRAMIAPLAHHARLPMSRFHAIPNPLPAGIEANARQPWPLGDRLRAAGAKLVLAVGRLTAVKDYPTLIRAFAGLPQDTEARLIILGEGEERPRLEQLVDVLGLEGKVLLPGYEPNPFAAMARANVFVLSSRFEGMPNVLIQALACGASVISTDCPTGPREILENGKWGRLVPVGDWAGLRDAIQAEIARPSNRPGWSCRGQYSIKQVADRYHQLLFKKCAK